MDRIIVWVSQDTIWLIGPKEEDYSDLYNGHIARFGIDLQDGSKAHVVWCVNTTQFSTSVRARSLINLNISYWKYPIDYYCDGKLEFSR